MLNNPSFENMGWVANSSCTVAFDSSKKRSGSYSLKVTSTSSSESLIVTTDSYKITKNHIYYVRVYIYQNTADDVGAMQCYWPIAEPLMGTCNTNSSFVKKWQMMSWRNTRSNWSTGGNYQFRFDFENMASGKVAWIDDAMLIDLTECFGSGNEPDKTWCDSNIPYFEKTYIYGTKLSIKTSTWKDLSSGLIKIPTIPQTYTPLEYIEGTGTQYINTGITPTQNTSFSFGVYMKEITGACIIGCDTGNDNNDFRIFNYNGQIYWDIQTSRLIGVTNSFPINQKFEFEVGNNYVKKNGTTVLTGTTISSFTGDCPIQILRDNPTGSSICAKGKVYYLKIYNSGTLVRNMLPCKNESGIVGMYDIIEKKFYNNNGTGTFIAGPIKTHWKNFKNASMKQNGVWTTFFISS